MISAIMPVYGSSPMLPRCEASLRTSVNELVIVDDGSGCWNEMVTAEFQQVSRKVNGGFAAACNDGVKVARHDWLLFINSDVMLLEGCVEKMLEVCSRNRIVGAKLLYDHEQYAMAKIQHGGVFYDINTGYFDHRYRFQSTHAPLSSNTEPCLVTGALLLIHRSLFEKLRGFDTAFRMAFEEIDLELRALAMGAEVIYQGQAEAIHLEGATRGRTEAEKAQRKPEWRQWERQSQQLFHERYPAEVLKRFANREGPYETTP